MARKVSSERESFWRGLFEQRRVLGLTVGEVCERAGVSRPSFYHWQQRLRKAGSKPLEKPARPAPLVPVTLVDDRGANISLECPGGIVVRVPAGCDPATLHQVLHAVLSTARGAV